MVSRRSLLKGSVLWSMATALSACGAPPKGLRVRLLSQSVPVQIVSAFQRSLDPAFPTDFSSEVQPQQLFELLQRWNSPKPPSGSFGRPQPRPDLISLGDAWLGDAIRQELIQPWDLEAAGEGWPGWSTLSDRFQTLVRRNDQGLPDAGGRVWALPYRWGTTAIAFHRKRIKARGGPLQDWADLWRPALQGRIGLLDDPREVIGLTLKSLGYSYNQTDPTGITELQPRLQQLQRQVKFYSSTHYVQPLLLKDVDVVVGWSTDLLPLAVLDPQIQVIVPQSGTALWADLWVRPAQTEEESLSRVQSWVNFCWQPEIAPLFSRFGQGTSPQGVTTDGSKEDEKRSLVLFPEAAIRDRSEFLLPLTPESRVAYRQIWHAMRQG